MKKKKKQAKREFDLFKVLTKFPFTKNNVIKIYEIYPKAQLASYRRVKKLGKMRALAVVGKSGNILISNASPKKNV